MAYFVRSACAVGDPLNFASLHCAGRDRTNYFFCVGTSPRMIEDRNGVDAFQELVKVAEKVLPNFYVSKYFMPNGAQQIWFSGNNEHIIIQYTDDLRGIKMICKCRDSQRDGESGNESAGNPFAANPTEWFCLDCRPLIHAVIIQSRAEALEEAAKICDKRQQERYTADCSVEAGYMAEEIRALKEKQ